MKKGLVSIFCLLALTFTALPVGAQTRYRRIDNGTRYEQRVSDSRYRGDYWNRDRSFWDRHRDKITTGAGAGGGAVLGGLLGGKKGSIIGAIVGGGGAALYTYGIRDDNNNWRQRRY
jgi:hypothetical protein